ncbi:hypothetical protein ACIBEA_04020 [Streptomyces sp. NPDC051555]|uniref:hypothetical protein n=1 Tax=Streptomyces sp. NPDC051555 TaxID=3365657 RepID=UPI00378F04B0
MDESTESASTARVSEPLWATGLAVLLVPLALLYGAVAPMATDGCGPDDCARSLEATLAVIMACWFASWTVTPFLVVASWLFPRRPGYAPVRRYAGWIALVPPVIVVLLAFTL